MIKVCILNCQTNPSYLLFSTFDKSSDGVPSLKFTNFAPARLIVSKLKAEQLVTDFAHFQICISTQNGSKMFDHVQHNKICAKVSRPFSWTFEQQSSSVDSPESGLDAEVEQLASRFCINSQHYLHLFFHSRRMYMCAFRATASTNSDFTQGSTFSQTFAA